MVGHESIEDRITLGTMRKRRNDLVVFVGRNAGEFHDNVKYLYLHAISRDYGFKPYFFTMHEKEFKLLQDNRLPVITLDGRGVQILTAAGMVVMDDQPHSWIEAFQLALGAKKLQLWHAIALKIVGIPEAELCKAADPARADSLRFGYSACETVLSTSPWATREHFSKVFKADRFIELGYPRTDVFTRVPKRLEMLNAETSIYAMLKRHKKNGGKVAIYMPTFRDLGLDFLDVDRNFVLEIPPLAQYVEENNLLLLLKLHPYMRDERLFNLRGVARYPNRMDIYPLLPLADVLITDYSSVSLDFLLLDKPIIYFAYDKERYINEDRGLWFDYETLPGPIVQTQAELLRELSAVLYEGRDSHRDSRKEWREKLFLHYDGKASERICGFIKETLNG